MTAIITRATVVGGHDGRAEIEVEFTYDNGGTSSISLDEEACTASLDRAGIRSLEELVGRPWSTVLPALQPGYEQQHELDQPQFDQPQFDQPQFDLPEFDQQGETHARSRHP